MSTLPTLTIGICGASASGKTTFTRKVLSAVNPTHVAHVAHDAYYHGPEAMPAELRQASNFDHPAALVRLDQPAGLEGAHFDFSGASMIEWASSTSSTSEPEMNVTLRPVTRLWPCCA